MKLVAYLRVSTDSQIDRYGLPSQRADVTKWAKAEGHEVVRWYVDEGVSGIVDTFDRPGLTSAIDALDTHAAEGLVTPKLDRLARKLSIQEATLERIWRSGASVFIVETGLLAPDDVDDPAATAMRQVMGAFAQLERSIIMQRTAKGRAAKAAAGGYAYGSPPFGWRSEAGVLVPHEGEQRTLARILELHAEGVSTRAMIDVLEAEGHRPKRADTPRFSSSTLSRIITRNKAPEPESDPT